MSAYTDRKVMISAETLHWIRHHIAECKASPMAIRETLKEIDEALGKSVSQQSKGGIS